MQPFNTLHLSAGVWVPGAKDVNSLKDTTISSLQYIFIEEDVFNIDNLPAPELVELFDIPKYLLTDVYRRSNGFYNSREVFDSTNHVQTHRTWFRFLVKMTARDSKSSYTWHEMTFCSRWTSSGCMMLCIGVPGQFRTLLLDALSRMETHKETPEPYTLHVPLLEAIVAMQDLSLWSMRDIVRGIEKARSLKVRGPKGFLPMHEAARHAIHITEVLHVSVQTAELLLSSLRTLCAKTSVSSTLPSSIEFQIQMLRNLLQRSMSNKERLHNEVAQAHNMISQQDSDVMRGLGEAAKRDSGAMRTIAVVTMAFLPPTFLSAIFSMSFFSYTPPPDSFGWSVSSRIWIYFLSAVPLTLFTLGVWFWGARMVEGVRMRGVRQRADGRRVGVGVKGEEGG